MFITALCWQSERSLTLALLELQSTELLWNRFIFWRLTCAFWCSCPSAVAQEEKSKEWFSLRLCMLTKFRIMLLAVSAFPVALVLTWSKNTWQGKEVILKVGNKFSCFKWQEQHELLLEIIEGRDWIILPFLWGVFEVLRIWGCALCCSGVYIPGTVSLVNLFCDSGNSLSLGRKDQCFAVKASNIQRTSFPLDIGLRSISMVIKIGMRVLIIINCCRLWKCNYSLQRNRKVNINILLTKLNEIQK